MFLQRSIFACLIALWWGVSLAGSPFISGYRDANAKDDEPRSLFDTTGARSLTRFSFNEKEKGLGDAAVSPFGAEVQYKVNALDYNLYLSDQIKIPFQLFYGELASDKSPERSNEAALLDPTQGIALQFPVAYGYHPNGEHICGFMMREGACLLGGDLTLRGIRLNEKNDAGEVTQSYAFGASASLKASLIFPISEVISTRADGTDGKLGISVGARYYYHSTDKQDLLFGKLTDPDGNPISFKKGFAALAAESEFDIYKYFKIRLEYFSPFNNRDALDDVFRVSIVVASPPKDTSSPSLRRNAQAPPNPQPSLRNSSLESAAAASKQPTADDHVTLGLVAAQKGAWLEAWDQFQEALRLREHPDLYFFSSVALARLNDPYHAYVDGRVSGLPLWAPFGPQQKQILDWAYPAVAGTNADCLLRSREPLACDIDKPGTLAKLVQGYFGQSYDALTKARATELSEAATHWPCGRFQHFPPPPPFDFIDTEPRCAARRVFSLYTFPPAPAITLPAPGFVLK